MNTYEITLDPTALDANDDASTIVAFVALANDAGATFANVVVATPDAFAFANDLRVRFDATPADVARYADAYDADEAIERAIDL